VTVTILSSQQFNQDSDLARSAAKNGPVFITDHGELTHVLLSIEEYRRLTCSAQSLVDMLAIPGGDDFEFEPLRSTFQARQVDLS